jgi:hypothetical protein
MQALAWGAAGHQRIGALAEVLLRGTHAEVEVRSLLGEINLGSAAVWADCVKGVDPSAGFRYEVSGQHPECRVFETATGIAEMRDFVRRNHDNCNRTTAQESCHRRYHYTDVSITQGHYDRRYRGARSDDLLGASSASLRVLQGQAAPVPFRIKDRREALLLLCHYLGDLHQPLHVGAVYLTATGVPVDPQAVVMDQALSTRGGNALLLSTAEDNLHRLWDDLAPQLRRRHDNARLLRLARRYPVPAGRLMFWPGLWADDTLVVARRAFAGLTYSPTRDHRWSIQLPTDYATRRVQLQELQLAKAGARLAVLLQAVWP